MQVFTLVISEDDVLSYGSPGIGTGISNIKTNSTLDVLEVDVSLNCMLNINCDKDVPISQPVQILKAVLLAFR